jgi:hypothetical protein
MNVRNLSESGRGHRVSCSCNLSFLRCTVVPWSDLRYTYTMSRCYDAQLWGCYGRLRVGPIRAIVLGVALEIGTRCLGCEVAQKSIVQTRNGKI